MSDNDEQNPRQPRWTESGRRRETYRPGGRRPEPGPGTRGYPQPSYDEQAYDERGYDQQEYGRQQYDERRYDDRVPPRDATRVMPAASRADYDYGDDPSRAGYADGGRYADRPAQWADDRPATRTAPRPSAPTGARRVSAVHRRRRIGALLALLVAAWLAFLVITPLHAWSQVSREDVAPTDDRPAAGVGTNFLLVGSDSRLGMTDEEKAQLSTGSDDGARTDSIILVHVPGGGGGKATMVSIPRDSYVKIPGHSRNKINAAYSIGGPKLLVDTVEQSTGVRLDGYVEIGFVGFAHLVDALGGVTIDVPFDMNDPKAGINLKKGTQELDGAQALGFVRSRYTDPEGDLGRAKRQRQFLAAIMSKAMSPATVLLPNRYWNFTHTAADSVQLGDGTSMLEVYQMLQVLRGAGSGDTVSLAVPASNLGLSTGVGLAVKWDTEKAKALFDQINADTVPAAN